MVRLDEIDNDSPVEEGAPQASETPLPRSAFRERLIEACRPHFDADNRLSGGDYKEDGKEANGDVLSYLLARSLLRGVGIEDPKAYLEERGIYQPKLVSVSQPEASAEDVGNDD